MASQGVFSGTSAPRFSEAGERTPRARYARSDLPALLWRERWLMLEVFLGAAVLGAGLALSLKTLYPAHASLMVDLGRNYAYEAGSWDARDAAPDSERVLNPETEILGSQALRLRVVRRIGVARLAPAQARAYAAGALNTRDLMIGNLGDGIARRLRIDARPDSPVIRLTYENSDPRLSALVLNTLLEEYLVYRRAVLSTPAAGALDGERRSFEQRLAAADAAYQSFLSNNQIGDFDAEKGSLSQLSAQIEQQQYAADAALKEKSARLAAIEAELAGLAPEIGLYRDSDPAGQTLGSARTGLNPVFQTFQTEKLELTAEIAALREAAATLADQMSRLTERRLRLAQLEPRYQALSLDRDVLQGNVKDFTAEALESEASQEISAATNDNIRIVERASAPTEGKSLRGPALALSLAVALLLALCAGLTRMLLRTGLPTPATAARVLDLPVLGAASLKQPA